MTEKQGGHLVAEALAEEGVSTVFTLCGGHIMPIYDGCLDQGIDVVDVRHEQAATMAADGWARLTGEPGVALVTAGPGVANGTTGVVNAYRSDSPIVVLGGQGEVGRFEQGALQEMDHVGLMDSVTEYASTCLETRRLPEYVHKAFRHATAPRTGPSFLEVPWDVLFEAGEPPSTADGLTRTQARTFGDPEHVEEAADTIADADQPVVMAGQSTWWCDAAGPLQDFIEATETPVYLNSLGRGSVPSDHRLFFSLSRTPALEAADVVLNVGTPLDFRMGYGDKIPDDTDVIHVDVDGEAIAKNRRCDVGLVGNVGAVLEQLTASLADRDLPSRKAWLSQLQEMEAEEMESYADGLDSDQSPLHSLRLANEVDDFIDDDTIVVGDGGNLVALAAKVFDIDHPDQWLDPGPLGCLGVGPPFALAAKLAKPDKRVLVYEGDGSFGLNGFEFETLVRHDLPVVMVVGNDGGWTQISQPQRAFFGEERMVATELDQGTRYDKVVEALGGHGEFVDEPDEVAPAIDRAFESGVPACVNVAVDPDTNVGAGTAM
jgi:acetolactate synthase-1/2/3 large subunit